MVEVSDFIVAADIGATWAIPFAVACTAYFIVLAFRRFRRHQHASQPPFTPFKAWLLIHICLVAIVWLCALGGLWLLDYGTDLENISSEPADSVWDFRKTDFVTLAEIVFTYGVAMAAIGFVGRPIIEKVFTPTAAAQVPKGPPAPRTWFRPPLWLQGLIRQRKAATVVILIVLGTAVPTGLTENPTALKFLFGESGAAPVAHSQEKLESPTNVPGLNFGQLIYMAEFFVRAIVTALIGIMIVGPWLAWYLAPMNPPPFTRWEYRFLYLAMGLGNLGLRYALEAETITPLLRISVAGESI